MGLEKETASSLVASTASASPGVELSRSAEDALNAEANGKRQKSSPKSHKRSHSDSSTATTRIDPAIVNSRYLAEHQYRLLSQ